MPDDAGLQRAKVRAPRSRHSRSALSPTEIEGEFDETAYLAAFPDVADAVRTGELGSALEHYRIAGRLEQRLQRPEYRRQVGSTAAKPETTPANDKTGPAVSLDAAMVSHSGAIFITGWLDDRQSPLTAVGLRRPDGKRFTWTDIPRVRRADVETALGTARPHQVRVLAVRRRRRRQLPAERRMRVRTAPRHGRSHHGVARACRVQRPRVARHRVGLPGQRRLLRQPRRGSLRQPGYRCRGRADPVQPRHLHRHRGRRQRVTLRPATGALSCFDHRAAARHRRLPVRAELRLCTRTAESPITSSSTSSTVRSWPNSCTARRASRK